MNTTAPLSTAIARAIENTIISGKNSNTRYAKIAYSVSARLISTTVFPIFLLIELTFKQIPALLISFAFCKTSAQKNKHLYKIGKYCLAILCNPLSLLRPDIVSSFFLEKCKKTQTTYFPRNPEELQKCVQQAIKQKLKVCVIGSGTSLGTQIAPSEKKRHMLINLEKLHEITIEKNNAVKVQSGAKWKDLMIFLNARGKSIFVKQPMSDFSIGGSISINCHGWDTRGSICNTILALEIINDQGELKTLTRNDNAFACFFGTLGYYGVIVSVTLKLTENVPLIQRSKIVDVAEFNKNYQKDIKKRKDVCICYGKICLDENKDENKSPKYFREICIVSCQEVPSSSKAPLVSKNFASESMLATILEEIAIHALSWFPYSITKRIISLRWILTIQDLLKEKKTTRNEVLHFPTNVLDKLKCSDLHTLWLQEYFIKAKKLSNFIVLLGAVLKANQVSVINATIRFLPKDEISILPYAKEDCLAVVICFYQEKTNQSIKKTQRWIKLLTEVVIKIKGTYYMAYMPFQTQEDFVKCYGSEAVTNLDAMKKLLDPNNLFSNAFTNKYFNNNNVVVPHKSHKAKAPVDSTAGFFFGTLCNSVFLDANQAHAFFNKHIKKLFSSSSEEDFFVCLLKDLFEGKITAL